ncbi:hypothetical protein Vadar_027141 [Vaccinium darrowii]|uniref:Uncharacterized protein n=1 Tax=Vaccinium darrowii TaxID=229202 RepID=A0ACB7YG79_9ERIC|nr:hypothetical protein Vadar_027141 [Vaccinium darrowii]
MAMQWWLYILHLLGLFMELAYRMVERQCMQRVRSRYRLDFYDNRDVIEKWVYESDSKCMNDFRIPRRPFVKLCHLLSTIGKLEPTRHMLVDEQVAIFLHTLAHHIKNRTLQNDFHRSAEAISRSFRKVLIAVIRLQGHLYKKPEPIPENSTDERWKWFKGCLGALDGTHIPVQVPAVDRPRYRNRKGTYYLVDAGYTNGEGFLAPYRGQRDIEDVLEEESRNEGSCDTENLGIGIEEMEHFLLNKEESTSQGKKRKRVDDSLDAFREAAMIIGSKIEEATDKFSEALGVDLATAKKRDKINEELLKLSNLSMIERHRALLAIARDHQMTGCFFTLKDEEKEPFVKSLLKGEFDL